MVGYDSGGPFELDHFRLTKGRTDLREFLWRHWHKKTRGIAEAKVGTIDAGLVTAIYIVEPDSTGNLGIDVEIQRPIQPPPCDTFHADSLVRLPIQKPDEDYPSQTLGFWPPDKLPAKRLPDTVEKDAKYYQVQLALKGKPVGDTI
jgi:hypothetical protein